MFACEREGLGTRLHNTYRAGFISGFRSRGGQMLSTKIKGGSGLSTNYIIRCTKNPKGGGGGQTESKGGQKHPLAPPEINPDYSTYLKH